MEGREEEAHFYQDMGSFWHTQMSTEMEICFCTFQILAFTEAYVSSLTLCFCSLDMAKSSQ